MHQFNAEIEIIGINPFVFVPEIILKKIFEEAAREKGPVPIKGTINGEPFVQTLMKYKGFWRLYINMTMLKDSPRRIGERIEVVVTYDPADRTVSPHPKLIAALEENSAAKKVFDSLSLHLQKEIIRYISYLKTEESVDRNIEKAIKFLLGEGRFVGRELN